MKTRLALVPLFLFACGEPLALESALPADDVETSQDEIADVDQSPVKRQSIGNCWLYATASWAESLHRTASGETVNLSESYWTYWHWFDQIQANPSQSEISTGGYFGVATRIIRNYGFMLEGDFISSEAEVEMSLHQSAALAAMNASLKTGALSTQAARSDRALVRRELDKAWKLNQDVIDAMDAAFGPDVLSTLATGVQLPQDSLIAPAKSLSTVRASRSSVQGQPKLQNVTLAESMKQWNEASYPYYGSPTSKRTYLKRLQRAVHDRQPLIITWFVDFNALDNQGRFAAPPTTPGSQGGHMVVIEDYQINDVPGVGTLKAGELVTDPAILNAALSNQAKIEFIRVKNSWGAYRVDRQFVEGFAGYHDLYMAYLDASIKQCNSKDGRTDTTDCPYTRTPFTSVIFPSGY
jgi:hypothetical protein